MVIQNNPLHLLTGYEHMPTRCEHIFKLPADMQIPYKDEIDIFSILINMTGQKANYVDSEDDSVPSSKH